MHQGLTLIAPRLPTEMLDEICQWIAPDLRTLASLTQTHSSLRIVATQALYRNIPRMHPVKLMQCLDSLSKNEALPSCVRSLVICVTAKTLKDGEKLTALIHSVLMRLHRLQELAMYCWHYFSLDEWYPFSLRKLKATLHCDEGFSRFLNGQKLLEKLYIVRVLPQLSIEEPPFHLSHDAAPRLRLLSYTEIGYCEGEAGPLRQLLDKRPVQELRLDIHPLPWEVYQGYFKRSAAHINILRLKSGRIFSLLQLLTILESVACRLPQLRELDINNIPPLLNISPDVEGGVERLAQSLCPLKYLSTVNLPPIGVERASVDAVVAAWRTACPSLADVTVGQYRYPAAAGRPISQAWCGGDVASLIYGARTENE